jgi:hypothetical protein
MPPIHFPQWPEALAQEELPDRLRRSFEITIRWYLGFCRRGRAEVTAQSARDFIDWAAQQKRPQDWQLEQWKGALRWLFRTAKAEAGSATPMSWANPAWGSRARWMTKDGKPRRATTNHTNDTNRFAGTTERHAMTRNNRREPEPRD